MANAILIQFRRQISANFFGGVGAEGQMPHGSCSGFSYTKLKQGRESWPVALGTALLLGVHSCSHFPASAQEAQREADGRLVGHWGQGHGHPNLLHYWEDVLVIGRL